MLIYESEGGDDGGSPWPAKQMPLATLAALQREAIYTSGWLSNQTLGSCASLQALYETETCCSGALSSELVMFRRSTAACELGWRAVTLGGLTKCLKLHPTAVWTKAEASAACAGEGAVLVEPRTQTDDATIKAILAEIDSNVVGWLYFWIGTTQDPDETVESAGWTWDSDGAALTNTGWQAGQPTSYAGAEKDGPEDCALYRKGYGWYDFACSPAASVVCMVPYFFGTCWGASVVDGFVSGSGVTSGGQPLCLKLLGSTAYSPMAAKTACMDLNAQLYYPTTLAENDAFAAWVYTQTAADTKVWLNIEQNKAAAAGDPSAGWTLPDGTLFGSSDGSAIPWNSPSDPEPTEPFYPSQDYLNLLVTGSDGALQPALPPPPPPPLAPLVAVRNPYFTSATSITTNADWPDGTGFRIDGSSGHMGDYMAGWNAFHAPGDHNQGWGWLSDPGSSTIPEWVAITYPEPVRLYQYMLTMTGEGYFCRRWTMQGSSDSGAAASRTWTDIGALQIPNPAPTADQVFNIDVSFNTVEYASYRVVCPFIDEGQSAPGHRGIRYIELYTVIASTSPPAAPASPSMPPPVHGKWQDVTRMADGAGALCVRPSPLPQPPPPP